MYPLGKPYLNSSAVSFLFFKIAGMRIVYSKRETVSDLFFNLYLIKQLAVPYAYVIRITSCVTCLSLYVELRFDTKMQASEKRNLSPGCGFEVCCYIYFLLSNVVYICSATKYSEVWSIQLSIFKQFLHFQMGLWHSQVWKVVYI